MQCKSCNTELPKHAKVCPRCGALVGKKSGNLKVIAIIGLVIAFIGGGISGVTVLQSGFRVE